MNITRRTRLLAVAAIVGLALTGAGCAKKGAEPGATPSPAVTTSASAGPTAAPSSSAQPTTTKPPTAYGPVWPLEPRTLQLAYPAKAAALTAIRTGRHETYDRVVFDLSGKPGPVRVRYVPIVHADPSDLTVALLGNAFLEVTIQSAYAQWGGQVPSYQGPNSRTPAYPALQQVTLSGDFENVLSFGIGVSRTAGFKVITLTGPDRLVIDIAHTPAWRMWPDSSWAQAQAVQASFDAGHQPWRSSVLGYYATQVYGWSDPVISRIAGTDEYWISAQGSVERVRVRQVYPFAATHPQSIAEIADVR